jgi:hypothetical protein
MSGSGYDGDRDRGGDGGPSRRPSSSSSAHQSPASASTSSSSRHHVARGEVDTHGWPTPSVGGVGVGGYPSPRQLPRITTSSPGPSGDGDGPRSAPPRPPNGLLPRESQPLRSSSSPDPRTPSYPGSERSSPTEPRPYFAGGPAPVLGSPFPVPRPHRPTASPTNTPLPIPPRKSSQTDLDRVLQSQNSHTSLSDGGHSDATQSASTLTPREQRTGRSRDPTYCGQCGQVVHGQFVRAMGKVFHLNCFRCKVSTPTRPHQVIVDDSTLTLCRTATRSSRKSSSPSKNPTACSPSASATISPASTSYARSATKLSDRATSLHAVGPNISSIRYVQTDPVNRWKVPRRAFHLLRVRRSLRPKRLVLRTRGQGL